MKIVELVKKCKRKVMVDFIDRIEIVNEKSKREGRTLSLL